MCLHGRPPPLNVSEPAVLHVVSSSLLSPSPSGVGLGETGQIPEIEKWFIPQLHSVFPPNYFIWRKYGENTVNMDRGSNWKIPGQIVYCILDQEQIVIYTGDVQYWRI